jgi:hypothetical protein
MTTSLKPGTKLSISKQLLDFLAKEDEEDVVIVSDDFDQIIKASNLRINYFAFTKELDLAMFVLNNRRVIQRPLSKYRALNEADEYHLWQYQISDMGIHWPDIDADISLRGLLIEEAIKPVIA